MFGRLLRRTHHHYCRRTRGNLLALVVFCSTALPAHAAPTRVALLNAAPELAGLAACLADRLGDGGPLMRADTLPEGLEFRMQLRSEPGAQTLLVIQGLFKPDMAALLDSLSHDDDPEAQPEASRRFFQLLRIPVGTRAWMWQQRREASLCGQAAAWVEQLRSRPILFDRLGVDGDAR